MLTSRRGFGKYSVLQRPMIDLKLKPTDGEARVFAASQFVVAAIIGWFLWSRGFHTAITLLLCTSGGVMLTGLLRPDLVRWLYAAWMLLAFPIGFAMSYVVAGLVYFLLITPIGLALRLFGHDPIRNSPSADPETYWVQADPPADPKQYFRQF